MTRIKITLTAVAFAAITFVSSQAESEAPSRLITLDPGHFHAALVQKSMVPGVSPEVHIYAPAGPDLDLHLERIRAFCYSTS